MLYGIALAALWLAVMILAMGKEAATLASRAKLEEMIERSALRERYLRWLDRLGPVSVSCVLGRVCATAALVAIAAGQALQNGRSLALYAAAAAAAVLVAELIGRSIGRRWSAHVLVILLPPLQAPACLIGPFHTMLQRLFGQEPGAPTEEVVEAAKEEIRVAIEDAESEGALRSEEKEMIEGVLEFRDVEVSEIMTPRTEIEWIEVDTPLREAVPTIHGFLHSRIPVYEDNHDRSIGIVHVKDLLCADIGSPDAAQSLRGFMREPIFVPETKRVAGLLRELKQKHAQIAIVLDEYGGVTGLVTIEDIVEEIVGEIEDEFDREDHESRVRIVDSGAIEVDGRVHMDEVNELLGVRLPEDEDYDTVGGFVMARFASVPRPGEETRFDGVLIRVLESDSRRVRRVLLQKIEDGVEED